GQVQPAPPHRGGARRVGRVRRSRSARPTRSRDAMNDSRRRDGDRRARATGTRVPGDRQTDGTGGRRPRRGATPNGAAASSGGRAVRAPAPAAMRATRANGGGGARSKRAPAGRTGPRVGPVNGRSL